MISNLMANALSELSSLMLRLTQQSCWYYNLKMRKLRLRKTLAWAELATAGGERCTKIIWQC